jgi:hypothetical protein
MYAKSLSKLQDARRGYAIGQTSVVSDLSLVDATVRALHAGDPFASNYEIIRRLHISLQRWAWELPSDGRWTTQHIARGYRRSSLNGWMGRYEDIRHGKVAHLLPIGIHFSGDPGRAFELSVAAANLLEVDGGICLGAGALAMLTALICEGVPLSEAVHETMEFFMCVDWGDDLVGALRYALRTREQDEDVSPPHTPLGPEVVFRSVRALLRATSLSEAVNDCITASRPDDEIRVVGVLASLVLGTADLEDAGS